MKKYMAFLCCFLFLYGCSEIKENKQETINTATTQSSNQATDDLIEVVKNVQILENAINQYVDAPFDVYKINKITQEKDYFVNLFKQANINLDDLSLIDSKGIMNSWSSENEENRIHISSTDYNFNITKADKLVSDTYITAELKVMESSGYLTITQDAVSAKKASEDMQIVEKFLKEQLKIDGANIEYIHVDEALIEKFIENYDLIEEFGKKPMFEKSDVKKEPFTHFLVKPKINNIDIFDQSIPSSDGDYKTSINGTFMEFIVKDSNITEFAIFSYYDYNHTPSHQVSISKEQLLTTLREYLKDSFITKPVVIDQVRPLYMAIYNAEIDGYEYRPTLELISTKGSEEDFNTIYIDIEQGEVIVR